MSDLRTAILLELAHGPLNAYEIAQATSYPPFSVRAELKSLKRERLVLEVLTPSRHEWELANRGHELVHLVQQQTIWAL